MTFADPGLVGDDDHRQVEIVQHANRARDAGQNLELTWRERRINDARVLMVDETVDDSVAVEKYGCSAGHIG